MDTVEVAVARAREALEARTTDMRMEAVVEVAREVTLVEVIVKEEVAVEVTEVEADQDMVEGVEAGEVLLELVVEVREVTMADLVTTGGNLVGHFLSLLLIMFQCNPQYNMTQDSQTSVGLL